MADSVKVRTAVGACLIAAFVGLLALDHGSGRGWGAVALSAALMAAGMREYCRMTRLTGHLATTLILGAAAWSLLKGFAWQVDPRLHHLHAPLAIALAYGAFFASLKGSPTNERFQTLQAAAFGFFYVPFLGGFSLDARFAVPDVGEAAFFYVIAVAKGSDICAYFTGKALGKTKVVPSVSPGKTAAGFVGAVVGGALITCLFSEYSNFGRLVPLPVAPGVGIVMALVVISGDLIESFMKRAVATKDSANVLPGYGGILDVVDSVIIAAPVVHFGLLFLEKVRPLG